jgi:hypothetical protein
MTEDQIKEIAGIAWKGAANAHRLYPNNKHTFSDYWEGAKSQFDQFSTPKEEVKELPGVQDWINEGKRIDAILEDFHQKKIDMLEVRKQILEPLFHKVFSTDSTLSPEQSTPKIEVVDTPKIDPTVSKEGDILKLKSEFYQATGRGDFQNETELLDIDSAWNWFESKFSLRITTTLFRE